MNIKEYLDIISPEEFEKICCEYLVKTKSNKIKIVNTRFVKDGGKDILGIAEDVPYEIWAECKKHTRAIGLEEISKNVVLAVSQDVKELIYFSLSNITPNAQKHISIVAKKKGFIVAFHYGENLCKELFILPRFRKFKPLEETIISFPLSIQTYLSQYQYSSIYQQTPCLILQRDNDFYIELFLKNKSLLPLTNVSFEISYSAVIKIELDILDQTFTLEAKSDRVVQFHCQILNSKEIHFIPKIILNYEFDNVKKGEVVHPGKVDPTKLIYFPLIGERVIKFVHEKIVSIMAEPNTSYVINLNGDSGTGKSRIIKEILRLAQSKNWQYLSVDCKTSNDFRLIKELLCLFLGIPYMSGNISVSISHIKKILGIYDADGLIGEFLYNFIFKNLFDAEILYYVKEVLIQLFEARIDQRPFILCIDNFQLLSKEVAEIVLHIVRNIYKMSSKNIIILCSNLEVAALQQKEFIDAFFSDAELSEDDYYVTYECIPMNTKDAKTLYLHALDGINDKSEFLDKLLQKSGGRPFDIIMMIKYLQEENIIEWKSQYSWYISDFNKFTELIEGIPHKSALMLKKRLDLQKQRKSEFYGEVNYWKGFCTIIKSLIYFNGLVYIDFLYLMDIDDDLISEVNNSLFIKFDENLPAIRFYHDNIMRYFEKMPIFTTNQNIAKQIIKWFLENVDYKITNYDSILFRCYLDTHKYIKAKEYGEYAAKINYENYNFDEAARISKALIQNDNIQLTEKEQFHFLYLLGNCYREKLNHEQGVVYFKEAYCYMLRHPSLNISKTVTNKFYHDCSNAHLNADHPEEALEILKTFEKSIITDEYYLFILHDRMSVAYLALDDLPSSLKEINIAINIANKSNQLGWISIAYSDKAYIYYNGYEDLSNTTHFFGEAVNKYEANEENFDSTREAEILQQKALINLLNNNFNEAASDIEKSITNSIKVGNSFLEINALNLQGIIATYNGNYSFAMDVWEQALLKCNYISNIRGKIKIYNNLGALMLQQHAFAKARDYLSIGQELYFKNPVTYTKHKPLFYNSIICYRLLQEENSINELLAKFSEDVISTFADDIKENYDGTPDSLFINNIKGIINFSGRIYNY